MDNVKANNMLSKNGKAVPNQIVITTGHGQYFQSYNTAIAHVCHNTGQIFLDESKWDYSPTTSRYRNQFLGLTSAETKAKIESGEIKLVNLN